MKHYPFTTYARPHKRVYETWFHASLADSMLCQRKRKMRKQNAAKRAKLRKKVWNHIPPMVAQAHLCLASWAQIWTLKHHRLLLQCHPKLPPALASLWSTLPRTGLPPIGVCGDIGRSHVAAVPAVVTCSGSAHFSRLTRSGAIHRTQTLA